MIEHLWGSEKWLNSWEPVISYIIHTIGKVFRDPLMPTQHAVTNPLSLTSRGAAYVWGVALT